MFFSVTYLYLYNSQHHTKHITTIFLSSTPNGLIQQSHSIFHELPWNSGNFSQWSNFSTSLFRFLKHSSKKSSKTLPNLTSSMSTSKAHMTLGLNQKGKIQPHAVYAAQIMLSHNHTHRPEDTRCFFSIFGY